MTMVIHRLARTIVPFSVRLEILRLRRLPRWLIERRAMARRTATPDEAAGFTFVLASHSSPLERVAGSQPPEVQLGKEANVARAAIMLDGVVVAPNQVFSHHHVIGRTSRLRGFRPGLELRNGEAVASVGGGLCQVSNSFYWVAVQAGMRIVERHRHGLDLFPDHERTVPFGAGATVVYNYADFRFENPLDTPVMLGAAIDQESLVTELRTRVDPGFRVEVEEVDHRFFKQDGEWWRENRLRRRFHSSDGTLLLDQEIAHNRGRVMYEPDTV